MTSTTRPQPSSSPSPRPFSQAAPSSQATRLGEASNKFRASIGVPTDNTRWGPPSSNGGAGNNSNQNNNYRGVSPGRASTGGGGNGQAGGGQRPGSEAMGMSLGGIGMNQSQGVFHSAETEAIDRWFEDLQHYEATLEEMAAASLDTNFKEELSAIEQWFRVLSEAERTAALYSLLQSATQMQMRFFITVLQQMARSDPTQAALLSPANPNQQSLEAQMEQKMSSMGVKSPSSPMIRQFARSSLGPNTNPNTLANEAYLSPNLNQNGGGGDQDSAQSTLAAQRAKLKASSRTSAPANLLLGNSMNGQGLGVGTGEGLKSPLWSKEETVRERSPSPRPKSTGSTGDSQSNNTLNASNANSQSFLRSPALADSFSGVEGQLSPLVGGSWASMVNTPLVPMFGKNGETMEPGNFGQASTNPPNPTNLDSLGQRLGNWQNQNQQAQQQNPNGGIVLDDVRKFRRSARVSGGALSGMYEGESVKDNNAHNTLQNSALTAQKRVQDQLQAVQQLKNMQQSAMSLGLASLPSPNLNGSASSQQQQQGGGGGSRVGSSGALNSPGLQQTAMQAQQNWRNQNAPQLSQSTQYASSQHANQNQNQYGHSPNMMGMNSYGGGGGGGNDQYANIGLGTNLPLPSGLGSPSTPQQQAQQQLASLIQLQQQMMQQQQQLQTLAGLSGAGGLGVGLGGLGMMGTGANLSPNMAALAGQMMGNHQQISPRLGNNGQGGGFNGMGLGMGGIGGMPSPRRSPRPHDRSPSSFPMSSHRSGNSSTTSQLPSGSGSNPDEPLDFSLLGDTPSWLRSLRLHKYTPNFEGIGWKEMVKMSDEDLEKRGVSALGARRKLTKVFETVRSKTGMSSPSAPAMDPSTSSDSTPPSNNNNKQIDSQDEKENDHNDDEDEGEEEHN